MIPILARALVLGGALLLVRALFTTRRLIGILPEGRLRQGWRALWGLVLTFLAGYLGYAWVFANAQHRLLDLFVPGVFFLGACFVWLTSTLSRQTALSMRQISQLQHENMSDPLTQVFNRRYLDQRLQEECIRSRRHGQPLSVLLLDIDHFKQVNDCYGHRAGDQVLVAFAECVKGQLRKPDILARYGGEEFIVIATQTSLSGAVDLAERLRLGIQAARFGLDPGSGDRRELSLTCSIGVASLGSGLDEADLLVCQADECLYRAKRQGRNRVCAGLPEAPGGPRMASGAPAAEAGRA